MTSNEAPKGSHSKSEHILVITSSYPRSPGDSAGHFVASEVESLRKRGHRVTVLAGGRTDAPMVRTGVESGLTFLGGESLFDHPGVLPRLRTSPSRIFGLAETCLQLRRWDKSPLGSSPGAPYDRVIAHWLFPSVFPWVSCLSVQDIPLTVVFHGSDLQLLLRVPRSFRHLVLRSLARRDAKLRFVSQQMKDELARSNLPSDLRQFVEVSQVQPSAIELPLSLSRKEARLRLGLDSEQRWAVIIGRLIEGKRPRTALSAAALIPDLSLAVIGSGPLLDSLKKDFPEALFLGQLAREEALTWLSAADLSLCASVLEGAPTAVREARYLGTPVIAKVSGDLVSWAQSDPGIWLI